LDFSEKERIAAARNGDRSAYDAICQAYRPELLRLCLRFLGRLDDAEDVVQDVFARAWQHLETYRGEASIRTWLWQIGRNLCMNRLRVRKGLLNRNTVSIYGVTDAAEESFIEVADSNPTPEKQVVDAAHVAQIKGEIATCAKEKNWQSTDWQLFALRIENSIAYGDFAQLHGRDEAYWRNRWRDKIKPVLERVRDRLEKAAT
jgi:RNA polymerase sigma factor (sigma-70 family)